MQFGIGGTDEIFHAMGYNHTHEVPYFLQQVGLGSFEYECGHGVWGKEKDVQLLGQNAKRYGIQLSVHAPFYTSMSGLDSEKRMKSLTHILLAAKLANIMGASRIVVHTGSCAKQSRKDAMQLATKTFNLAVQMMELRGYGHITLCPETMGQINQLGDLEEVLELCYQNEKLLPCIDFGHLNARTAGSLKDYEAYNKVLEAIEASLGSDRGKNFHAHFSKIAYTLKGGEVKHLTFEDQEYGPPFEPLMQVMKDRGCNINIICESAGSQSRDAMLMQQAYNEAVIGRNRD